MTKRKVKRKKIKAPKAPTTIEGMQQHLRRQSGRGDRYIEHPTPERALKANGALRQGGDDSNSGGDRIWRVEPLLEQLGNPKAKRPKLWPNDPALNLILLQAGQRYRYHYHAAGIDPLKAIDISRMGGLEFGPRTPPMYTSEWRGYHLDEYRSAKNVLDPWLSGLLNAIVVQETPVADAAIQYTFYEDRGKAIAAAMERLRGALVRLAIHFQLASPKAFDHAL